jgi:hypothetical protein
LHACTSEWLCKIARPSCVHWQLLLRIT